MLPARNSPPMTAWCAVGKEVYIEGFPPRKNVDYIRSDLRYKKFGVPLFSRGMYPYTLFPFSCTSNFWIIANQQQASEHLIRPSGYTHPPITNAHI